MDIEMKEVRQKEYTFSNDNYLSVFVGVCKSQEILDLYMEKDYELLNLDYIGSEFGIDLILIHMMKTFQLQL